MPLAVQLALLAAVAVLAVVVVTTLTGFLPRVVSAIGTALGGFTDTVLATPTPIESVAPIPAAPVLTAPDNPYTNKDTVAVSGTVPLAVVGRGGFLVRIYVSLPDQEPVAVREVAVGETPSFVVPDLHLEQGRNDVSATVVGPGVESEISPSVLFVLDTSKPKITVVSPKNGAKVNGATAKITGKTQAGAVVVARNEATGTAATSTAGSGGAFTLQVPLSKGTNGISLTATDQAGNVATAVLTIRRGSGALGVALSASAYRISAARLPRSIVLQAQVTDPDGRPMAGQSVAFTLTIPGVPAITGEDTTNRSGTATFKTTIPAGATAGSGLATAFVSTPDHGNASGRATITITK
jgi:hypothetical protein